MYPFHFFSPIELLWDFTVSKLLKLHYVNAIKSQLRGSSEIYNSAVFVFRIFQKKPRIVINNTWAFNKEYLVNRSNAQENSFRSGKDPWDCDIEYFCDRTTTLHNFVLMNLFFWHDWFFFVHFMQNEIK